MNFCLFEVQSHGSQASHVTRQHVTTGLQSVRDETIGEPARRTWYLKEQLRIWWTHLTT